MANLAQVRTFTYNGEDIGMGFNSDTGLAVGTCLDFTLPKGPVAQEASGDVSIITSQEELMTKMSMSGDLEGHYSIFSGGIKSSFTKSTNYNSSSTFVLANLLISNTVTRGKDFALKPTVQHLLDTGQMDTFATAFGDSFVRAQFQGGEFYAVMRITSVDSKTESDLSVTLHLEAEGGIGGGSFKGQLDHANSSESTRTDFSVKFYQRGGAGKEEVGTTLSLDDVKARLKDLPEAVKNHPFPYVIEVATYDTVPLPTPPKVQLDAFLETLADCEAKHLAFLQKRNDCDFAAEHPEFFADPPSAVVLRAMSAIYTQLLNGVIQLAIHISKGDVPPTFFDPSKLSPPVVEPVLILRKKDVGLETSFVDFWVNRNAPTQTKTDRDLVADIGFLAADQLNDFNSIVDPSGDPAKTARLQGQALAPVIASFRSYSWDHAGTRQADRGPLRSLAALPTLLPKTVQSLSFSDSFSENAIANTEGLDQFTSLVGLGLSHNAVSSIKELAALPLLRDLHLDDNSISDLTPLAKCISLETLDISGNGIADLTPLGSCKKLKNLVIFGTTLFVNGVPRPSGNPITDILALGSVPALANPFTLGNTLSVRFGDLTQGPAAQFTGTATRVGNSNIFRVHLTRAAEVLDDTWTLRTITALDAHSGDQFSLFFPGVLPGDLPASGSSLNINRGSVTSPASPFDFNISYVNPANPKTCGIDLAAFPAFGTKIKFPTFDATVVS